MNLLRRGRSLLVSRKSWIRASTVLAVGVVLLLIFGTAFWDAFRDWLIASESGSTTIRNLGLVAAGLIALPLALWRGHVAEQQANAAQQGLRNERYQKGAEMLGSDVLSVRLGGIYGLQRLAREHPEEYHVAVMQLFCAFVRNPTNDEAYVKELGRVTGKKDDPWIREDVQAVMTAIGKRDSNRIELESNSEYTLRIVRS